MERTIKICGHQAHCFEMDFKIESTSHSALALPLFSQLAQRADGLHYPFSATAEIFV
jgi:hypothetical protein